MRFQNHESFPVDAPGSYSAHFDERNMVLWGADMRKDVGVILSHGINDSNVAIRNSYNLNEMYKYYGIEVVRGFFYQAAHAAGHTRAGSWLNQLFPSPSGGTVAGYTYILAWLDHYLWGVENDVVEKSPNYSIESNLATGTWTNYDSWPLGHDNMQRFYPTGGRTGKLSVVAQTNSAQLKFRDDMLVRDVNPYVRPNRSGAYFDNVVAGYPQWMRDTGYEREAGYYRGGGLEPAAAQRNRWKNWIVGGVDNTAAWANTRAGLFPSSGDTSRFAVSAAAMDTQFDFAKEIPDRLLFTMPVGENNFTISGVVAMTAEVAADKNWGALSAMLVEIGGNNVVRIVSYGTVNLRNPNPAGTLSFEVPALGNLAFGGNWVPNYHFQPVDIVPGTFYPYTFELDVTEYTFTAGRQIGLIIFGTDAEYTQRAYNPPEITVNLGPNTFLQLPAVDYVAPVFELVVTVAPTCEAEGYELWRTAGGYEERRNVMKALGHDIVGPIAVQGSLTKGVIYCQREGCGFSEEIDLPEITSVKIDAGITETVARGGVYSFDVILNEGAYDIHIAWTLSDPSYGLIDDEGKIYILNKTGTVRLIATDPVSGLFHSIVLRVAS